MTYPTSIGRNVHAILGAVGSARVTPRSHDESPATSEPFVTISRQAGAGAEGTGARVVELLNTITSDGRPWTYWDRELVEKVASDHQLSQELIDSLEETGRLWLVEFARSMSLSDAPAPPNEIKIYHRVASTIRALAGAGRAVIVGRGGAFITRGMPNGVHVYLMAPLAYRVDLIARRMNLSSHDAAQWIKQKEKNRLAFYRHFWPGIDMGPESFSLTINTADAEDAAIARMIYSAVVQHVAAAR